MNDLPHPIRNDTKDSKKLIELIREFDNVMFITIDTQGNVSMRPMRVIKSSNQGELWFAVPRSSGKVDDILEKNIVYITAQSGSSTFISLKGKPKIFDDELTKNELWSEPMRIWFPEGVKDPNLCFIRVEIEEGEWWDNSGLDKVFYLVESIKSYLIGDKPPPPNKVHGIANLDP